jgi:hypothetical protein
VSQDVLRAIAQNPALFDGARYLRDNPDVARAFGDLGSEEGKRWSLTWGSMQDDQGNEVGHALTHYIRNGAKEGRQAALLDAPNQTYNDIFGQEFLTNVPTGLNESVADPLTQARMLDLGLLSSPSPGQTEFSFEPSAFGTATGLYNDIAGIYEDSGVEPTTTSLAILRGAADQAGVQIDSGQFNDLLTGALDREKTATEAQRTQEKVHKANFITQGIREAAQQFSQAGPAKSIDEARVLQLLGAEKPTFSDPTGQHEFALPGSLNNFSNVGVEDGILTGPNGGQFVLPPGAEGFTPRGNLPPLNSAQGLAAQLTEGQQAALQASNLAGQLGRETISGSTGAISGSVVDALAGPQPIFADGGAFIGTTSGVSGNAGAVANALTSTADAGLMGPGDPLNPFGQIVDAGNPPAGRGFADTVEGLDPSFFTIDDLIKQAPFGGVVDSVLFPGQNSLFGADPSDGAGLKAAGTLAGLFSPILGGLLKAGGSYFDSVQSDQVQQDALGFSGFSSDNFEETSAVEDFFSWVPSLDNAFQQSKDSLADTSIGGYGTFPVGTLNNPKGNEVAIARNLLDPGAGGSARTLTGQVVDSETAKAANSTISNGGGGGSVFSAQPTVERTGIVPQIGFNSDNLFSDTGFGVFSPLSGGGQSLTLPGASLGFQGQGGLQGGSGADLLGAFIPKIAAPPPAKLKCFGEATPVEMADGSTKPISEISLGEETRGGIVEEIITTDNFPAHRFRGIWVTGRHPFYEGGKWMYVEDSHEASPRTVSMMVYVLVTAGRRIWVNGMEFADGFNREELAA